MHYSKGKVPKTSSIATRENITVFDYIVYDQHVSKDEEFARRPEEPRTWFISADIEFVSQSKNKDNAVTTSLGLDISFQTLR